MNVTKKITQRKLGFYLVPIFLPCSSSARYNHVATFPRVLFMNFNEFEPFLG